MKNVPVYSRVDKQEYRQLRRDLELTCSVYGFDFYSVWDLMIDKVEERHANVLAGKRKSDISIAQAVSAMQEEVLREYRRRQDEVRVRGDKLRAMLAAGRS